MNAPQETPLASRLGQALGEAYTIEGEIGRGGMGVVYRARDERLQRRVAIKVLPPELAFQDEIRQRFISVLPRMEAFDDLLGQQNLDVARIAPGFDFRPPLLDGL